MINKIRLDKNIIFDTAARIAEEVGIYNITLNQLAERLNIRTPSLYNHITGIDDLYKGLCILCMRRIAEMIKNAAVGKSKSEALMEIALEYRKFVKKNPELYKAILKVPDLKDKEVEEAKEAIFIIIKQVMKPFNCSEDDVVHFSRGFRSAVHGFVSMEQAGFFITAIDKDESYTRLVSSLISTLISMSNK